MSKVLITPKDWEVFQHYKHRNPPWIKLHKAWLDDFEFQSLSDASRALAPMLWLLASESIDAIIDATPHKLAFRLRMTESKLIESLNPLISIGKFIVLEDASAMLAQCKRDATTEKSRVETEKSRDTQKKQKLTLTSQDLITSYKIEDGIANDFLQIRKVKKLPLTKTALTGIIKEASMAFKTVNPLQDALRVCCENGWAGFKSDWLQNKQQPQNVRKTYDNEWLKTQAGIDQKAKELGVNINKCANYNEAKDKIFDFIRSKTNHQN